VDIVDRLEREYADRQLKKTVAGVEDFLQQDQPGDISDSSPILFFNASTRIHTLSLNAAISLISSWSLRSAQVPVYYAVCDWGMRRCILGTDTADPEGLPPCKHCVKHSQILFPQDRVFLIKPYPFVIEEIEEHLSNHSLDELEKWQYEGVPLGELCIPGLRWAMRRHHLNDDEGTRTIFRQYLASAASLVHRFGELFDQLKPATLVIFNGLTFPEAVARFVSEARGIPVITHEVGLLPFSAFFSHGDATFRELEPGSDFQLDSKQNKLLTEYLDNRFQGKYTMAGIRFWPEMKSLPVDLVEKMNSFSQIVPVFTNVIFDTSQVHANTLFVDMFDWLDTVESVIRRYPDTLFVIRAHPDEDRPGKESLESVANWVRAVAIDELDNVVFLGPAEMVSSYEIIRRSKFVLVYNSSIGLEASIIGAPVLCAGRARYTQMTTVYFPESEEKYMRMLENFLRRESVEVDQSFATNARRFLYYELYRASLDFSEFMKPYPRTKGMTLLKNIDLDRLRTSPTLAAIRQGIVAAESFTYQEEVGS
jgi:hypothetical protein